MTSTKTDRLARVLQGNRGRWIKLLALLIYFGVAVGITWPLAARMTTHLPGPSWDSLVHYWNGWWARQALIEGRWPFHTDYLFYPQGISLVYHNFAWLSIVGWLLLEPLAGGLAAYNLCFLINLALCGLAVFLLTHDLTGDARAAFLAGLIYQCWPFRISQLDHPNLVSTQCIPLFLLFTIRTMRQGRWRDGALAGLFLALTGYTRWQQLIPAATVGGVYVICSVAIAPAQWKSRRRWMPPLLLAGVIAAVALAPPVLLLVSQQRATPADLLVEEEEATKQVDLLAYVTPGASHPVLGELTRQAYDRYYGDRDPGHRYPAYVGVIALLLAGLGIWKAGRAVSPWLAMALVLVLLALGPTLRVNGRLYPSVSMPYRLAARLFIVRLLRFPGRFNMFLALPVAVLAAYGAVPVLISARRRSHWAALALLGLLGAAVVFEYLAVPIPLDHPRLSSFYVRLREERGEFAVLNLPMGPQESKRYMFAQAAHRRPILQGKTARFPEMAHAYLDGHPLLRVLRQYNWMDWGLNDVSGQLASLAEDDVRYIMLHKALVGEERMAQWQRYLLTSPRFEDDAVVVYATSPVAGTDFALVQELAPGVGVIGAFTSTDCLSPGRVLEVDVGWGTTAAPGRDLDVELALLPRGSGPGQREYFSLSAAGSAGAWPANAVNWGYYTLRADPSLVGGTYTVTLALVDAKAGAAMGPPVAVGRVRVSPSPCTFAVPPDVLPANALFGDDLRLLGYRLRHRGTHLDLTLHWRAERRMATDYKIFVHVFDPATGVPVAQDDAMPHRWAYPTRFWTPGEEVEDTVPIFFGDAPAGVYGVALGVYDPTTMERLPVEDGAGRAQPDGRFVLPGEMVEVE